MRSLGPRLDAVVALLEPCRLLADVGTDHGLVPIAAVALGIAERAIAADLREAPLALARQNVERAKVGERVAIVRGDGLAALAAHAVDAVVMAGLSGATMAQWCEAAPGVLAGVGQIVAQPNTFAEDLRTWARLHGFWLVDERMLEDAGRSFVVLRLVPGQGPDPAYARAGWSAPDLARVGPLLLARRDPVAQRWYRAQADRLERLAAHSPELARELETWRAALV